MFYVNIFYMQKLILSLFIVVVFSSISFAQLGFRAGISIANQSSDFAGNSLESSSKTGPLFGINYKLKLGESLALRPGLQFTSKGNSTMINGLDAVTNINYLEVPVDVVFSFGNLGIHVGPYAAFLISAKAFDLDLKSNFKSVDLGLNIGLGYTISKVGLGVNYGLGLSNISNYRIDGSIKNQVLSTYLTYTL